MAYPFIKFPTFGELIAMLSDRHGITFEDLEGCISKEEDAVPLSVHYLKGTVADKEVRCVIDIQDYDERVTPSMLRYVCTRFKLDQDSFGSVRTAPGAETDTEG